VTFGAPSSGTLAYTYGYYYSAIPVANLGYVTFTPATGSTGTVTIAFTGYLSGGSTVYGTVTITVGSSGITYTTAMNTSVSFDYAKFYAAYPTLSTVTFNAPSSGTLSYTYGSYYSAIPVANLGYVTYTPATSYTGTVTVTFTGYLSGGSTVYGTVTITVGSSGITYTTAMNTSVSFDYAKFYAAYPTLSTVTFSAPSSGTLSYTYGSYYSSIPVANLGYVTYTPATSYTGTVTISFTGYLSGGSTVSGTVTITVGSGFNVSYTTMKNTAKTFASSDFSTAFTTAHPGLTLNYVTFALPTYTSGTLYYGYTSSTSTGSAVAASTAYYNTYTSPLISSVTFVPYSNYSGSVTVSFTAYAVGSSTAYTGTVTINVSGAVNDITLSTTEDTEVAFNSTTFNSICSTATGQTLSYVKFSPPSSSYGTLIYYTGSGSKSAVTASTSYNTSSSPYISYVSFVPAANYKGTVTLAYTGYSTTGSSYTGKIIIYVSDVTGSTFFTDVNASYDWAADAVDYLYLKGVITGSGDKIYNPSYNITRGDFILMLSRALNFTGTPSAMFSDVPSGSYYYNAIAAAKAMGIAQGNNNKFNPTGALTRQDAMLLIYRALKATGHYMTDGTSADLAGYSDTSKIASYALTAVQTLVKAQIITGSSGKLNPTGNLSRAEMAVIIFRIV
jgi:hypothetical protein